MKILLTGSTGFIGRRVREALLANGHFLVCPGRHPPPRPAPGVLWIPADFSRPPSAADWLPHVQDIDVVVNAVGIFRETGELRFDTVHVRAPQALFAACAAAGVPRVVQLSALGADENANTAFLLAW